MGNLLLPTLRKILRLREPPTGSVLGCASVLTHDGAYSTQACRSLATVARWSLAFGEALSTAHCCQGRHHSARTLCVQVCLYVPARSVVRCSSLQRALQLVATGCGFLRSISRDS